MRTRTAKISRMRLGIADTQRTASDALKPIEQTVMIGSGQDISEFENMQWKNCRPVIDSNPLAVAPESPAADPQEEVSSDATFRFIGFEPHLDSRVSEIQTHIGSKGRKYQESIRRKHL